MLHGFIHIEQKKQTSKPKKKVSVTVMDVRTSAEEKHSGDFTIAGLVDNAKAENKDIVQLLKIYMPVVEVAV